MRIKEWWAKLRSKPVTDVIKHKHRFVVMDTDTFKEKFSFQLSGINLFVTIGVTVILFILLTTVIIAFTPLREWIPGYTNEAMVEQTYANARMIDSLEEKVAEQEWIVATIQAVLGGREMGADARTLLADSSATLQQLADTYRRSADDSLLRADVEREDSRYQLKSPSVARQSSEGAPALSHLFFAPLKGKVLRPFEAASRHLGIDVAGSANQPVYAAYGGTVVSVHFTSDAGYVISVQHPGNVITVYRNTNMPLKHQGDAVRAGEPIAYVGNSGIIEPGPHLHFEMWVGGAPVDPEEYISF